MRLRQLLIISFIMVALLLGIRLLGRSDGSHPRTLRPNGGVEQLAPLSSGTQRAPATTGESRVHEPVSPTTVDFARVKIGTVDPDSQYNRWARDEVDLNERESIVDEARIAELLEIAREQEPDPSVQLAEVKPSPRAPKIGVSFNAIDYRQSTGAVPPDPELAVGPNHMIAVVNVSVAIYDKGGATLFGPTAANNLFSQSPCRSGLFDPNVLYDEEAHRWIIAYDQGAGSASGGYCLLASQSDDPLGTWYEYFFPLNNAATWIDFPHTGVGDTYIVMGANVFGHDNNFEEGRLFAFDKFDLYFGLPVAARERGLGPDASTPQPLNLHGVNTGTWPALGDEHYVLTDPYDGRHYDLRSWNPSIDALATVGRVNLGQGNVPVDAPQDGGGEIMANFWQPLDFEYRNGYGWTTMTLSCNLDFGLVDCIRWAQIDLADASLGPAGTGTYGSNREYRFFPDLAVNHCDDIAIGYTKSSESMYPAVWVTGRKGSTVPNMLESESQLKAGEVPYTAFDGTPHRWGDYTGMTIDPDGETFWYLGQYSKNTGAAARWGTYVGSLQYNDCNAPPPPTNERVQFLPTITMQPPAPSAPEG